MLLVARVIAGVGAAMIMPVTLSIITSTFPEEDRARAIGIWAGLRRRRRHPRAVRLVVHDRLLHLAVAVRHADRVRRSSDSR